MYVLENKVALVTGSTSGLGLELARQLCKKGASVVLNARGKERLETTAQEFTNSGFEVSPVAGDVSLAGDCRQIVEHCIKAYGRLDILVCNAGVASGGKFEDITPETFQKVFEINTLGSIYLTRFALSHIRKTRGSITFISSLAGLVGLPYSSLYSSTKMALTAIHQALLVELKGAGVHVGIVHVGFLKNSPEKRVMAPDGSYHPTGERKAFLLQPIEKAARIILCFIERRRRRKVLTHYGRLFDLVQRHFPGFMIGFLMKTRKAALKAYKTSS